MSISKRWTPLCLNIKFYSFHQLKRLQVKFSTYNMSLDIDEINKFNQFKKLAQVVTPYYEIPYEQQLNIKYSQMMSVLKNLRIHLAKQNIVLKSQGSALACPLAPIRPSPVITEYRNKDEFNIRDGVDGNKNVVGLYVGSTSAGDAICVPTNEIIIVKESHKKIQKAFQEYLNWSHLSSFDGHKKIGNWKSLIVRSNKKGDIMAIVIMHPQNLTALELNEEKMKLKEYFEDVKKHLCISPHSRCTHDVAPFEVLFGEPYLYEELINLKFRISPDSFFQINPFAAEILYKTVQEISSVSSYTTLLDVCCGTGVLSAIMAQHVQKIIAIDLVPNSIKDARFNCQLNNHNNVDFYAGSAEKVLSTIINKIESKMDVITLINPGRGGISPKTIRSLKYCPTINRLVYISCNPTGLAFQNFIQLCTWKHEDKTKYHIPPFIPKLAIPIDMFPHTAHCELIILFERSEIYE